MKAPAFYTLLLCVSLLSQTGRAQYLTASECIRQVDAIQESDETNGEKINRLQALRQTFSKAHTENDSAYARILHRLGDVYREAGDFEKGIAYTKEAVRINASGTAGAEPSYLTHSYYNLGVYYSLLYLFAESHQYFDSCIAVGLHYPEKTGIVFMAFEQKAYTYYQTGDYQKAVDVADRGMLLANSLQDSTTEAWLLSQKAQAQIELNELVQAEVNLTQAIKALRTAAMPQYLATAYSIFGRLLCKKKQYDAAAPYYRKAFALNRQSKDWGQCARDLTDLGYNVYDREGGDAKQALASYAEAIRFVEQANDTYQLAVLFNNIGNVYWRKQHYQQALRFFQKGLTALPLHFKDTALTHNPPTTELRFATNDYYVFTLLANKGETLLDQYKNEKNKTLLQAALYAFDAADQTIDLMRWKQQGEVSKFYWRTKTKRIYQNAIEACYQAGAPERAYYFFEKSRAVLLSDQLNELGAKKYLTAAHRMKEQDLRVKVFSLHEQLAQQPENTEAYNAIKHELLQAQDAWEGFIKNLETSYPAYYQYKYNNAVVPLQTVQKYLHAAGQTLVEYFTGDSLLYVLCIAGGNSTLLRLPAHAYQQTTQEFLQLCADGERLNQQYGDFEKLAYTLYQQLVRPLPLVTKRVIVSPDDQFLPFEALLYDTTAPAAYLLKKYIVSYTYSAGLLLKEASTLPAKRNFLGIAPVVYQKQLQQPPLTGADQSLQHIEPYFQHAALLTGAAATKQQFLEQFPAYRIVQIYSHAEADSSGRQPLLYLVDSALLLSQIQLPEKGGTELVVLSACRTGIGKTIRGEGVFSLARGFAAAGVPATITTLWQVDNKATYALTEAFYKYLSAGLCKDEAMQQAKLDLMQNSSMLYGLPYYWAGTILIGNAAKLHDLTQPTTPSYRMAIVIAALSLSIVFLLYWFWMRRQTRR